MSTPAGTHHVIAAVERLLSEGRERGASDLHLEPTADGLIVRLRLDGVLTDVEMLDADLSRPVVARLKLLADLLTYRTDIPQEGRLRAADAPGAGDLRVSSFPTIHGERVVVRFFDTSATVADLHRLGLPAGVVDDLERIVAETSGVVLLTGPANSGKTTTLYALLNHILSRASWRPQVNTLEDPVESALPGVTQTQINPAAGLTYASALRSLMRQDPEVLMVGEVRDRETADIVMQAGLTGHLVLSTLHGGDVATVLSRLLEMGLEPYAVTSAVRAAVALRLVRRLCEACRREGPRVTVRTPTRPLEVQTFEPAGCDRCGHTGYDGRLPLVELAVLSGELKACVLRSSDSDAVVAQLQAEHVRTLLERGLDRVTAGETTLDELRRVLGPVETNP